MAKKRYGKDYKIGVLGGGQLGRMMIQDAVNFDWHLHCLDPDENAPCSRLASSFKSGSLLDYDTVIEFGSDKDVITVEIENVNTDALEELEKRGKKVFPQPNILRIVQDKGFQKEFYEKNNIATAPFRLIEKQDELKEHSDFLPFVQKMRRGGYDGKGVSAIKTEADFSKGFDVPSVLEQFVDFEKELSVIVARNEKGEVKSYPTVECEFNPEANLVEFLFSPADISKEIEEKAQQVAKSIIEKLEMVGILAVELFLTKTGDILVNEIAPRPHNSGHQTIESNITSQFEQHLRAITNRPLGSTEIIRPGVMINILGEKGHTGSAIYDGIDKLMSTEGVFLHLYGKADTKPFRKMGHITVTNSDLTKAKEIANKIKNEFSVIA